MLCVRLTERLRKHLIVVHQLDPFLVLRHSEAADPNRGIGPKTIHGGEQVSKARRPRVGGKVCGSAGAPSAWVEGLDQIDKGHALFPGRGLDEVLHHNPRGNRLSSEDVAERLLVVFVGFGALRIEVLALVLLAVSKPHLYVVEKGLQLPHRDASVLHDRQQVLGVPAKGPALCLKSFGGVLHPLLGFAVRRAARRRADNDALRLVARLDLSLDPPLLPAEELPYHDLQACSDAVPPVSRHGVRLSVPGDPPQPHVLKLDSVDAAVAVSVHRVDGPADGFGRQRGVPCHDRLVQLLHRERSLVLIIQHLEERFRVAFSEQLLVKDGPHIR
mmetsp:Transcript_11860/g.29713  ORF Transcript_11860/g.29713 Transcript_11860/m.29713 type:complete len:330 (+) Transcript_11860:1958-2947(+)